MRRETTTTYSPPDSTRIRGVFSQTPKNRKAKKMTIEKKELTDQLELAFYMIRNWETADDEETRIDDDEYLDQLPEKIRLMCRLAIDEMKSCRLACQIYATYWLRQATYEQTEEAAGKLTFVEDWIEDWKEDDDQEMIESLREQVNGWIKIAKEWRYWR